MKILILSIRNYSQSVRRGLQNTIYIEKSKLDESLHSKIPVICLLGWTGARDSQLKKYSQIYTDLGYHTVRFSPTNKLTFLKPEQHPKYASDLVDQLNQNFQHNPLMFHLFSNAGLFIFYHHIIKNLNKSDKYDLVKKNERGQIIDSGLGLPHDYLKLYKGITHLLASDFKYLFVRKSIAFSLSSLYEIYKVFTRRDDYFTRAINSVTNDSRCLPALFLLSNADKLINPVDIKKNIEIKRNVCSSGYIKLKEYEDGDHVLLYAKYPDDYVKLIKEHLKSKITTMLWKTYIKRLAQSV